MTEKPENIKWDWNDPIKKFEDEKPKPNRYLNYYIKKFPGSRSLKRLEKQLKIDCIQNNKNLKPITLNTLKKYSSENDWQRRLKRWDEILDSENPRQVKNDMREFKTKTANSINIDNDILDNLTTELLSNQYLTLEEKVKLKKEIIKMRKDLISSAGYIDNESFSNNQNINLNGKLESNIQIKNGHDQELMNIFEEKIVKAFAENKEEEEQEEID